MENRAAVFTSSPQDVEVYRDGTWWAGSLLGWRHDSTGACQVWIRVAVHGREETSWLSLDLLRLPQPAPERHLSLVGAPLAAPADDAALTGTMAAIRAVPVPRGRSRTSSVGSAELTATMTMVAVRDLPDDHAQEGALAAPSRRPGGRRRAPEPLTGERPELAPDAGPATASAGRHRAAVPATATAGRHRAADTGVWPAVRDEAPAPSAELPRRRTAVPVLDEPDSHLLTRPMRLTDSRDGGIPQPRRGQAGSRLSEV